MPIRLVFVRKIGVKDVALVPLKYSTLMSHGKTTEEHRKHIYQNNDLNK
jgi:hypothetical protein